jgi:hypothetical protein
MVPPKEGQVPLVFYDERQYSDLEGTPVGFNGIANLTFSGELLTVEYRDIEDRLLLTETWRTQEGVLSGVRVERGLKDPKLITIGDLGKAIGGASLGAAG